MPTYTFYNKRTKKEYTDLMSISEMEEYLRKNKHVSQVIKGINIVAKKLGISVDTGKGYRALANISEHGGQEVPHLHFHLFGGERVGKMVE